MEKKQNRSVQAQSKGSGTESKKNQDVTNSKYWPRSGRRREPVGGTSKNEPNRKPIPQRNKSLDKRPKPRGYYAGFNSGKENTGVIDHDAELGSVFVPGSKKQSLNHLLNFHYTPRGENSGSNTSTKAGTGQHRWLATQKHKYNKEQFLQANCQFVVSSEGDYKLYMNNPDALVDWDLVQQINVQVTEFPSCPICLYPPVASKITRCGHIYCWSCILHYLALSDKTWRKCPICYESVHKDDLKSVTSIPHSAFNVGEYITLRLMKRAQGSLTAVPVDEAKIKRNILLNMSETKVNTVYSKLLLANSSEVMSIIDREKNELTAQLIENENCPEKCFIEQAITLLNDREKVVCEKISQTPSKESLLLEKLDDNRRRFESISSEEMSSDICPGDDLENATSDNNYDNTKYYYFYQAADGQHIYLHAINTHMLEYTYGSLDSCPRTLQGRIIEKEGGSMTEEIRRRLKYLQHLPVTCQFEVAEIHLKPPIISKETLDHFQEQLETRKKRRQKRARDEKRREKRILDEENRKLGKLPEVDMHIESLKQFPEFCGSDEASASAGIPETISERSSSPSLIESVPTEEQYPCLSFAKMLVNGKSKPRSSWPSPSNHPHLISVTRSQTRSTVQNTGANSDSDVDPDGYVPAPAFNKSFSDAFTYALEQASISNNHEGQSSGGKKKKRKHKVLFATSMVYSGK